MTPDHQQTIETTLQLAYARALEWNKNLAIPPGKNPPQYTHEMLWNSPLGRDLVTVAGYVEGYSSSEDTHSRKPDFACRINFTRRSWAS